MRITKALYEKIKHCRELTNKHTKAIDDAENELKRLGVDIDSLRQSDDAGYVDMVDYGTGFVTKDALEEALEFHKKA